MSNADEGVNEAVASTDGEADVAQGERKKQARQHPFEPSAEQHASPSTESVGSAGAQAGETVNSRRSASDSTADQSEVVIPQSLGGSSGIAAVGRPQPRAVEAEERKVEATKKEKAAKDDEMHMKKKKKKLKGIMKKPASKIHPRKGGTRGNDGGISLITSFLVNSAGIEGQDAAAIASAFASSANDNNSVPATGGGTKEDELAATPDGVAFNRQDSKGSTSTSDSAASGKTAPKPPKRTATQRRRRDHDEGAGTAASDKVVVQFELTSNNLYDAESVQNVAGEDQSRVARRRGSFGTYSSNVSRRSSFTGASRASSRRTAGSASRRSSFAGSVASSLGSAQAAADEMMAALRRKERAARAARMRSRRGYGQSAGDDDDYASTDGSASRRTTTTYGSSAVQNETPASAAPSNAVARDSRQSNRRVAGQSTTFSQSSRHITRATEPGMVQMRGRAYGLRGRRGRRGRRSRGARDEPITGSEDGASHDGNDLPPIQASLADDASHDEEDPSRGQPNGRGDVGNDGATESETVAYAESVPSTAKLILNDGNCRIYSFLLLVAGCAIGITMAVLLAGGGVVSDPNSAKSSGKGGRGSGSQFIPTASPTVSLAPTLDLSFWLDVLSGLSSSQDLRSVGSPQHSAMFWLATQDTIVSEMVLASTNPEFVQRYACAVLFFALGGDEWEDSESWLNVAVGVCDGWHSGIRCQNIGGLLLLETLDLSKAGLTGYLPHEIRLLRDLKELHLGENAIVGSLPTSLGEMDALQVLNVEDNLLTSSLPSQVGAMSRLRVLDVSDNRLDGAVPLQLYNLEELRSLDLSFNQFSGMLASEVGRLRNLVTIDYRNNQFGGTTPIEITQLVDLAFMYFDNNRFSGTIPGISGFLTRREEFTISNNLISGTIPQPPAALDTSLIPTTFLRLKKVDISGNRFYGPLRGNLGLLQNLKSLDLSRNGFTGSIPPSVTSALNLEYLNISFNYFTGVIPPLGKNGTTKIVDAHANRLAGGLPYHLFLDSLELLDLSENILGGPIPRWVGEYPRIRHLSLRNCGFEGSVPEIMSAQNALRTLDLGFNFLTGSLPESLADLSVLRLLKVDNNLISGDIPHQYGNLSSLTEMDLSANRLTGTIPTELSKLSLLKRFHVQNNGIEGSVPSAMCALPDLKQISLDNTVECSCCEE